MEIRCPFLAITFQASPTAGRMNEIIQAAMKSLRFGDERQELLDLLFINQFSWPSFVEWDRRFYEMAFLPARWATPKALEIDEAKKPFLAKLHQLSRPALRATLEFTHPVPAPKLASRFGEQALVQLTAACLIEIIEDAHAKLPLLPLEHLRGIQRRLAIKGGRSRVEAAAKIAAVSSAEQINELLMPEFKPPLISFAQLRAALTKEWIDDRKMLVEIYLLTCQTFLSAVSNFLSVKGLDYSPVVMTRSGGCPVCGPRHGQPVVSLTDAAPPYHPGCMCSLFPVPKGSSI